MKYLGRILDTNLNNKYIGRKLYINNRDYNYIKEHLNDFENLKCNYKYGLFEENLNDEISIFKDDWIHNTIIYILKIYQHSYFNKLKKYDCIFECSLRDSCFSNWIEHIGYIDFN